LSQHGHRATTATAQTRPLFQGSFLSNFGDTRHYDAEDDARTHGDLREAWYRYIADDYELLVGVNRVFFGVTESRHLVDVVNQADLVEDIDEEDKLGQPMINLTWFSDWGTFGLYVMTGFRLRTFPGESGRLRTPLIIDGDDPVFESDLARWHPDVALRYSDTFGDWDLGLTWFSGTGREPLFVPSARGERLRPRYTQIHQGGLDLQYTYEAWLLKVEAIGRSGHGDLFAATVVGAEYTLYQLIGATDLGVLVEYLYDGREADFSRAPFTAAEDDIFGGFRLALNDIQDTSLLAGAIVDRETGATLVTVEAERRLGDHFKLELESRLVLNTEAGQPLDFFKDDSFVTGRLSWFF
ncbi:MAG: hypothetical protein ACE366_04765, partial [Bradymonadia bacterium]